MVIEISEVTLFTYWNIIGHLHFYGGSIPTKIFYTRIYYEKDYVLNNNSCL